MKDPGRLIKQLRYFLSDHGAESAVSLGAFAPRFFTNNNGEYIRHIELLKTEHPELYEYLLQKESEYD